MAQAIPQQRIPVQQMQMQQMPMPIPMQQMSMMPPQQLAQGEVTDRRNMPGMYH